jgi:CMP-N-acetylneuraminic acid synthetase
MTLDPDDIYGLIPARGGSNRISRKNLATIGDKPLVAHSIQSALDTSFFDDVYVSTDDEEIADVARTYGATVPSMRPDRLATDASTVVDVSLHFLDEMARDGHSIKHLCVLLPTTPLRNATDIEETIRLYDRTSARYAMAVTEYFYPPWQALEREGHSLDPFWTSEEIEQRTQELPDLCVDSGAVYVVRTSAFREEKTFYGDELVGYDIPPERAIDIDEQFQLKLARLLHNNSFPGDPS